MAWWFMSFADPTRPKGTQFLGGLLLEAEDFHDALIRSHHLGPRAPFASTGDLHGAFIGIR